MSDAGEGAEVEIGERWLADAGLAGVDQEELAKLRALRGVAIELLEQVRTSSGTSRSRRIALCGVPMPARIRGLEFRGGQVRIGDDSAELVTYTRLGCRDRWCPVCATRRHRACREAIEEKLARVLGTDQRLAFVTLTQPKGSESARDAVDRLLLSWRRMIRRTHWKRTALGGVRAVEVVYRRAGERVRKPGRAYDHEVKISGTHAHIHALVELGQDVDPASWWSRTLDDWRQVCPGAHQGAQDCQWAPRRPSPEVIARYAFEVGSYLDPADLFALAPRSPDYVREVMLALDGRRVIETFGGWRGSVSLRQPAGAVKGVELARASIGNLARSRLMRESARWFGGAKAGAALLSKISRGPPGGLAEVARELELLATPPPAPLPRGRRGLQVLDEIRAAAAVDIPVT